MTNVFLAPGLVPLLLLAPLAWLALRALDAVRRRRLAAVAGPRAFAPSPRERFVRRAFFAAGLLLAAVAAMEPAWGESVRAIEQRGADVVVCLDVSRSMLARDEAPSRLGRAKTAIRSLAAHARGDRIGLVAFGGEARLVVPLTRDVESFVALLETTDTTTVMRGGSDLGPALETALAAFDSPTGEREAIVVLTDGEDFGGTGRAAAARCRVAGVPVHCIGLGTELGAKIPVAGPRGEEFVRDAAGRDVVTSLDAKGLAAIAGAGGGAFVVSASDDDPLVGLYESRIVPSMSRSLAATDRLRRENRFQWPLLAAFFLFAADLVLAGRPRR